jgi:hypothetical protein
LACSPEVYVFSGAALLGLDAPTPPVSVKPFQTEAAPERELPQRRRH